MRYPRRVSALAGLHGALVETVDGRKAPMNEPARAVTCSPAPAAVCGRYL